MAEIFGTVAGALSVAALFNNCVDCFEYVHLARRFGQDYERCRLKLDIAQTRLSRWGAAVAINEDPRFAATAPTDSAMQQVREILEEIGLLFQSVQKTSKRYEIGAKPGDLVLWQDGDMRPLMQRLHGRLGQVVRQRQKQTSPVKKAAWALYDRKYLDKLTGEIAGFVDDLEKIEPVDKARRQLARLEIEEVADELSLATVRDAAEGVDSVLVEALEEKARGIAETNRAGNVTTQDAARVHIGTHVAASVVSRRVRIDTSTTSTAGNIAACGQSAVQVGSSFGGKGIFD